MATKILSNAKVFNPVKIEIEFCTREHLAAFITVMYNPSIIANAVTNAVVDVECPTDKVNSMCFRDMRDAINSLIGIEELDELVKLVYA